MVNAGGGVAVGGQKELPQDAVGPFLVSSVEGNDVVALLGNVELEALLSDDAEVVRGIIANYYCPLNTNSLSEPAL